MSSELIRHKAVPKSVMRLVGIHTTFLKAKADHFRLGQLSMKRRSEIYRVCRWIDVALLKAQSRSFSLCFICAPAKDTGVYRLG
jgi:hypothetical protein